MTRLARYQVLQVGFERLRREFGFEPKYRAEDGAREIAEVIRSGKVDLSDPRGVTVSW